MGKLVNLVCILGTEILIGGMGYFWWTLFNPIEPHTISDIVVGTMLLLIASLSTIIISYVVWDSCIKEEN